jgi:cellobiose transport system permease protein
MAGETASLTRARTTATVGRRRRLIKGPGVPTYVVLGLMLVVAAFPFYWMFVVASQSTEAINDIPPALVPGQNFLYHVGEVFARVPFDRALLNSLIVAGTIAIFQTFFCALAGFAFAKLRFPFRRTLFVLVVATMMVPIQLGVIPQFMIAQRLGWVNNLAAVIVPGLVSAFGVFWMRQYIAGSVSDEIIQAARVDGAGSFRTFRSVVFPMIRPSAIVLGLFAFMFAWNDFFWPLIVLQKEESYTTQVALRQIQNLAYVTDYGVQMAGTVIATLPLLILGLVLGKQLVGGIMEGAVKG